MSCSVGLFFFFQAEDGIRDADVTGVQTCALPIWLRAAVISNSNGSVRSILNSLELTTHLDFVLDSAEVGVEKPDPKIFELALAEARVAHAEAVYIGDLYSIDVRGARAAGMRAVLLDPGGHWGARDCPTAPDLMGAVRLVLGWR